MKIFNIGRQTGKSMRCLYASELNNAPIICIDYKSKQHLENMAREYNIHIPMPLCVNELLDRSITQRILGTNQKFVIDEYDCVLEALISRICHNNSEIVCMTATDETVNKQKYNIKTKTPTPINNSDNKNNVEIEAFWI